MPWTGDYLLYSREIERHGHTYRIDFHSDYDSSPNGEDWADREDIEAWENDEWHYVGVVVTLVLDGVDITEASDSLWGLQYGYSPGWSRYIGYTELIESYPVPEMIAECESTLSVMRRSLPAGNGDWWKHDAMARLAKLEEFRDGVERAITDHYWSAGLMGRQIAHLINILDDTNN